MQYHYPNSLEEIKDGDIYQVQYPMTNIWSDEKRFDSNICNSKKDSFNNLISKARLRILKKWIIQMLK